MRAIWTIEELISEAHIRCPNCRSVDFEIGEHYLICKNCSTKYLLLDNILAFAEKLNGVKSQIAGFWGDLYKQLYQNFDNKSSNFSKSEMDCLLDELRFMLKHEEQLSVKEIALEKLNGKKVLEIGCGAGAHSALFKKHGAKIVSSDISLERVKSTQQKLKLVSQGNGCAIQADAENLPFEDNTFDIVYSFGVLHHTENIGKTVDEIRRVLKPGGQVVVMVYAKSSFYYIFNLLLVQGIIKGNIFRYGKHWLGRVTEGRPKYSDYENPITNVYSQRQILQLFNRFNNIHLRKSGFNFTQVSILGRILPEFLVRIGICKKYKAGALVWNGPLRLETSLEVLLGRLIGFGWNITGYK